jgi:hypothetical protein
MAKQTSRPRATRSKKDDAARPTVAPVTDTASDESRNLSAPFTESQSMSSEPSEQDIRMRAYQRYLERGGGHGADFDDWLEAERELRQKS